MEHYILANADTLVEPGKGNEIYDIVDLKKGQEVYPNAFFQEIAYGQKGEVVGVKFKIRKGIIDPEKIEATPLEDVDVTLDKMCSYSFQYPEHYEYYETPEAKCSERVGGERVEVSFLCFYVPCDALISASPEYVLSNPGQEGLAYIYNHISGLKKVVIEQIPGYQIIEVQPKAFYRDDALEEVELPEGMEVLYEESFASCKSLHKMVLPSSLHEIKATAFKDSPNLKDILYRGKKDQFLTLLDKCLKAFQISSIEVVHCLDGDITIKK